MLMVAYSVGRSGRLGCMLTMTFSFFLVELIVGYATNSISLVADSFHMLSDGIALVIGLYAVRMGKKEHTVFNTYGWVRAEVIGALFNGVFLISLCLSITIEAIQRFFDIEEIKNPKLLLLVGGIGLLINVIGLVVFHDGHGHSHGGGGHGHSHGGATPSAGAGDEHPVSATSGLNMRGVFLHVLGDALGSVAVIISALVVWLTEWQHKYYLDPALSLFITAIILGHTVPLVRRSAFILMQSVPDGLDMDEVRAHIGEVAGIRDVHELHVWQLADDKLVASVHVTVDTAADFMSLAREVKQVFHSFGIHSTTVQPEFVGPEEQMKADDPCRVSCEIVAGDLDCSGQWCCNETKMQLTRRVTSSAADVPRLDPPPSPAKSPIRAARVAALVSEAKETDFTDSTGVGYETADMESSLDSFTETSKNR